MENRGFCYSSLQGGRGKDAVPSQGLKQERCLQTEDKSTDKNQERVANI